MVIASCVVGIGYLFRRHVYPTESHANPLVSIPAQIPAPQPASDNTSGQTAKPEQQPSTPRKRAPGVSKEPQQHQTAKALTGASSGDNSPAVGSVVQGPGSAVSINQQGGITAGTINVNTDRHLTDPQKDALRKVADLLPSEKFAIIAVMDGEAQRYAQEFYDVLTVQKKAQDSMVDTSSFTKPPYPIELRASGIETDEGTILARKVGKILTASGLRVWLIREDGTPGDIIEFVIGSR
jgi:hypothetical protein